MKADSARSGKSHRDENFPVASLLIRSPLRQPILTFYEFVRTADDIADHPSLAPQQKLDLLDKLQRGLTEGSTDEHVANDLRQALLSRKLSPQHALDLLDAFRLDVTKSRYDSWADLMHYCSLSAMPVGRFVLDLHGESQKLWPASDSTCAALQIINHLQDCREDYEKLDRVYLPAETLAQHNCALSMLVAPTASNNLRACISDCARRSRLLLESGSNLGGSIADWRLGLEISVIQSLAMQICSRLEARDPLAEDTHLSKPHAAMIALFAVSRSASRRIGDRFFSHNSVEMS